VTAWGQVPGVAFDFCSRCQELPSYCHCPRQADRVGAINGSTPHSVAVSRPPSNGTTVGRDGVVQDTAAGTGSSELGSRAAVEDALTLAHHVFQRWLGKDYDLDVLDVVLCCAAVEQLAGDPIWLLVVSGSGAAKTETVQALAGAGAHLTSTISGEGALLSGTSRKDRSKQATGGLLRKIGDHGLLVIKDVTSILSMSRDARATILAAMREVYDGRWDRNLGSDGGLTLTWTGRIVVIGAVTTAWDTAHAVVASMGDRFVLVRLDSGSGRATAGRRAIGNSGQEAVMRAELSGSVAVLLGKLNTAADLTLTDAEIEHLLGLADLVTMARTGVEHDYQGNVIDAHAPEMPTRFAKQLTQIVRGGMALGMPRGRVMDLATRCAGDSMPPLRLAVLLDVLAHPDSSVPEVRRRMQKPRNTVDRCLQDLHMLGLLELHEREISATKTQWRYSLASRDHDHALSLLRVSQKWLPTGS
jgi:hypothetical protein